MDSIYDSHFHIIEPDYPLIMNKGYLPDDFLIEDYKEKTKKLNIKGGTIVSASYQGYDQSYLVNALNELGPNFVGVTQLPYDVTDEEVLKLTNAGVRGIRLNIYNDLPYDVKMIEDFANRVYKLVGWHTEFHIPSTYLNDFYPILSRLPAVVIDHLGLKEEGLSWLYKLVKRGAKVKASGFGRVDFNIRKVISEIHAINSEALMFGTDLPSTRVKAPFKKEDIQLIYDVLGEKEAKKVLYLNAYKFYHNNPR